MIFALALGIVGGVLIIAVLGSFALDEPDTVQPEANIATEALDVDDVPRAVPDA